jgi:capsular polysaccharide biosynthesis protein
VVLAVIAISLASAWYYTSRQRTVYKTRLTLVVRPSALVEGTTEILRALETLERRSIIATLAKLPATERTSQSVARQLGVEPQDLSRYDIRGAVVPNSNVIAIDVLGPSRPRVEEVARAAASKTRRESRELYPLYELDILEEAARARRVYPNPRRNYVAAGILGLFLGFGAALVFDQMRRGSTIATAARELVDGARTD